MSRYIRWLVALLSVLAIACSPTSVDRDLPAQTSTPTPTATPVETPDAPIEALTVYLSQQTGVPKAALRVERVEAVNWTDSCLGLAQPNEMCLQAITPGFRVEFAAPERRFVVHSDRTGRLIRLEP